VKTTTHAARGNNPQPGDKLQIAEVTQQRAYEQKTGCCNKTSEEKHADLNKWTTPLVRWNKNFTKFKENFNRFFLILFKLSELYRVLFSTC
jgi:hypothetical protein